MGINQPQGYGNPQPPHRPNPQYSRPAGQPPQPSGPAQPQPPGYGPPPQHGPQGMPPQHGPQGMPPQGYYMPPPKKGMPGWAIALIIVAVFMFVVLPILALAAIPLITTNTSAAREAEGEHMLGSAKNMARVAYAKTGRAPMRLTGSIEMGGADMDTFELDGKYYRVEDRLGAPSSSEGELYATPKQSDRTGTLRFQYAGGEGKFTWK